MNLPNPYFQEVVDAHVDIEQWLSGRVAGGRSAPVLARLLARFSPRFTMITLQGAAIDFAGVDALFSQGHGVRSGLRIEIDALQVIAEWDGGAAIGYRETQADDAGRRTVRRSTAVFERDGGGRIVWRHLHETPAAE